MKLKIVMLTALFGTLLMSFSDMTARGGRGGGFHGGGRGFHGGGWGGRGYRHGGGWGWGTGLGVGLGTGLAAGALASSAYDGYYDSPVVYESSPSYVVEDYPYSSYDDGSYVVYE